MKKVIIVCVVLALALVVGTICLFMSDSYSENETHFAEGTIINDIDCSNCTVDEAKAKLTDEWNSKVISIKKNGETIGIIENADLTYKIDSQLEKIVKPNMFSPIVRMFLNKGKEHTITMNPVESKEFDNQFEKLTFLDNDYKIKTRDAYVDLNNHEFKIVKEVQGDNVDKDKFKDHLENCIAKGNFVINYKESTYYANPKVKSDSPDLIEYQGYCKKYYSQEITYTLYNRSYTIEPKYLAKMLPVDNDGNVSVDEKAVKKYTKHLAWEINTAYSSRKFKTAMGNTIVVGGGGYGYVINKEKEAKKLATELKAGDDVTRKPIYSQTPYYKGDGKNDIGNTYIEVDISNQTLYLYKNGKNKMSTSVVTGNSGNHDTPTGVYEIAYLQRNTTLKGNNDDGSDYNSKVSYWMPFNGSIGCHDASWRDSFGGTIYKKNGSHGCVNMPVGAAEELYYSIEKGYPVIVHY